MNQYIALAVAEKTALDEAGQAQLRYMQARAARAPEDAREDLLALLAKAPDVEPPPEDRWPE